MLGISSSIPPKPMPGSLLNAGNTFLAPVLRFEAIAARTKLLPEDGVLLVETGLTGGDPFNLTP